MGLLNWLSSARKTAAREAGPMDSVQLGLSRMDSSRPAASGSRSATKDSPRRQQRVARREILYGLIRECMTHSGVLAAHYKFKVLSLDSLGTQFVAMVDLAGEAKADTETLMIIERAIAAAAQSRHGMVVNAVYWRTLPAPLTKPQPLTILAVEEAALAQAQAAPAPSTSPRQSAPRETDSLQKARTREALARAFDGRPVHGPQSYTLLTGFEDTEMSDADARFPALSNSQYGDLR